MAEFGYKNVRKYEIGTHKTVTKLFDGIEEETCEEDIIDGALSNLFRELDKFDDLTREGGLYIYQCILEHYGYTVTKPELK